MRTFTLSLILSLFAFAGYSQTFYVEPTEKGFEKHISEKLKYEGYKLTSESEEADFKIECLIHQTSKFNSMYKGFVKISDKGGKEITRTKEVRKGAVAANGFNAGANIFSVIANKYLIEIVKNL